MGLVPDDFKTDWAGAGNSKLQICNAVRTHLLFFVPAAVPRFRTGDEVRPTFSRRGLASMYEFASARSGGASVSVGQSSSLWFLLFPDPHDE